MDLELKSKLLSILNSPSKFYIRNDDAHNIPSAIAKDGYDILHIKWTERNDMTLEKVVEILNEGIKYKTKRGRNERE